jgi:hypothetical protein
MSTKFSQFAAAGALTGSENPVGLQSGNNVQFSMPGLVTYLQAQPLAANLVPDASNTRSLGSASEAFAQLYLGPNAAPALDSVTGDVLYYARTAAEALLTIVSYAYPPGTPDRYVTNTTPGTTDMAPALRTAISVAIAAAPGTSYVYLLGETYYIGSKVTKTLNASISLHFQGDRGKTILQSGVIGATTLELYDCELFTMDGVNFVGNSLTGASGNGNALSLRSTNYGTSNTYFPQEAYLSYVSAVGFRGNDVDDGSNAMRAAGVYISEGLANWVDYSNFQNCGAGVYFDNTYNSGVRKSTISDCDTWGIWFNSCSDGAFSIDNDINGNGLTLGVYSQVVNGISIPYGAIFADSCAYDVVVTKTKMKAQPVAVVSDLCDNVSVENCMVRLLDTASSHGVAGVWANRTIKLRVRGGSLSGIPSGTNSFHYTGIVATAGNNSGQASVSVEGTMIIPADTMDNAIHIDGNGAVNNINITVRNVTVGNATTGQTHAIAVTNCVQLSNGTFLGAIEDNTWFAGSDAGSPITTITNTVAVGSGATVAGVSIANNSDVAYNGGVITNPTGKSQNKGVITALTDTNGDLLVTHGLIGTPVTILANPEGTTPYYMSGNTGTSTTFKIRVNNASGPVVSTSVTASWWASI